MTTVAQPAARTRDLGMLSQAYRPFTSDPSSADPAPSTAVLDKIAMFMQAHHALVNEHMRAHTLAQAG